MAEWTSSRSMKWLLGGAVAAALAACSGGGPTGPTAGTVASVQVTPAADTLISLGQTQQLTAVAQDAAGNVISGKTFSWQSSAPGVVSVDAASGVATGVANGAATITASVDGKSGQAAVAVLQQVAAVTVSPDTASLSAIGATRQFSAAVKDANGNAVTGVALIWLSSDHEVATIDTAGLATATGPGAATITAAARGVPGMAELAVTQTATRLAFSIEPSNAILDEAISPVVQVEVQDAALGRVAGARTAVTLAIGTDPGNGGQLVGSLTANAVDGIASFPGLTISNWGQGYTLVATANGLTAATSTAFDVTLGLVQLGKGASCGINRMGQAFCWGDNVYGEVGDGTTGNRSVPVPVAGGLSFAEIGSFVTPGNGANACGATTSGASYCWAGLVGDGTTGTHSVPWPTSFLSSVYEVEPGWAHTCAVTADHSAWCWGRDDFGQLGNNATAIYSSPALYPNQVVGGLAFQSVTTGYLHTCALTTGGTVYCWGYNSDGELGIGSTKPDSVPHQVGVGFAAVSAGFSNVCALASGGAAYCWGFNANGELGTGASSATPDSVPTAVAGGLTFATLSTGAFHTCGITTGGVTYCWGYNYDGEVGDGSTTERDAPVPVSGGLTFTSVVAGYFHTCGVTAGGAVYCWGLNDRGQLGDGTTTNSSVPVRVKGT